MILRDKPSAIVFRAIDQRNPDGDPVCVMWKMNESFDLVGDPVIISDDQKAYGTMPMNKVDFVHHGTTYEDDDIVAFKMVSLRAMSFDREGELVNAEDFIRANKDKFAETIKACSEDIFNSSSGDSDQVSPSSSEKG